MISRENIDKIKAAVNLKDLIEEYTDLKPSGVNCWQGICPHKDHNDTHGSFTVFKQKDGTYSWTCFGCLNPYAKKNDPDYHSKDSIGFLQWLSDYKGSKHVLSFIEVLKILSRKAGISLDTENTQIDQLIQQHIKDAKHYHSRISSKTKKYLYSRGLNDEDIENWYIGESAREEEGQVITRVIFPLFSADSTPIGFIGRIMEDIQSVSKYKHSHTSEIFHKKSYLYGMHCCDSSEPHIYVTEGVFDVISAYKAGLKNVVAVLGSSVTIDHIQMIKRAQLLPIFLFDSDSSGKKSTERALSLCDQENVLAEYCELPPGKDLDALARETEDLPSWIQKHRHTFYEQHFMAAFDALYKYDKLKAARCIKELHKKYFSNNPFGRFKENTHVCE